MPQVDLCSGGSCTDVKIACETLAGDSTSNNRNRYFHDEDSDHDHDLDQPELPPDFPPESFWLSGDAELDWFDRNAVFERKDSTKGSISNLNPSSESSSQRFSRNLKSKASIIGLPKPQKACFVDSKNRRACKPGNAHLFPKRSGSAASGNEPSSPKVSCMGRVRSKKEQKRRLRNRRHRSAVPEPEAPKPSGKQKTGLFSTFRAMFRSGRRKSGGEELDAPVVSQKLDLHDIRNRLPASDIDAPPRKSVTGGEPPGLGGMQRFASGRRTVS